jgi:hypothetical protein
MQQFDVLLKIFGRAIFEPVETKGGCLVKKANFEVENAFRSKKKNYHSNFALMCYSSFSTRNVLKNICLLSAPIIQHIAEAKQLELKADKC